MEDLEAQFGFDQLWKLTMTVLHASLFAISTLKIDTHSKEGTRTVTLELVPLELVKIG